MKIDVTSTEIDMKKLLEGTDKFPRLMLMRMLAIRNERIRRGRTTGGRSMLDGRGDRYTAAYEKRKSKAGRNPYSPGDRLVWSGAMLGSQHVEASRKEGVLLFSPEEAGKAWGNNRHREFIMFSRSEIDLAFNDALKEIRRIMSSK